MNRQQANYSGPSSNDADRRKSAENENDEHYASSVSATIRDLIHTEYKQQMQQDELLEEISEQMFYMTGKFDRTSTLLHEMKDHFHTIMGRMEETEFYDHTLKIN